MTRAERTYSLRTRTAVIAGALAAILVLFQLLYLLPRQEAWILKTLSDTAQRALDQLSVSLEEPLLKRDLAAVHGLVEAQLAKNGDWHSLVLTSPEGRRLYPLDLPEENPSHVDIGLRSSIDMGGMPLGQVFLSVNFDGALAEARQLQVQLVYFQLLILLASLVGALLILECAIFKPLKQLSQAFSQLTQRELHYPLPVSAATEIRNLVNAFDVARSAAAAYQSRLIQLRDDADSANRAKTAFLSQVSHELRTPLNSIIGLSELALEQHQNPASEHRNLTIINQSGRHLLALIQQILDLTQGNGDTEQVSLQPVNVGEMLKDCCTLINGMAIRHGVAVTISDDCIGCHAQVRADPLRLRQCLLNLLSNAIQYNRAHGTVTLDAQQTDEGNIVMSVSDEGDGLTEEEQLVAFRPFERLSAQGLGIEGTGIGLSITQHVVELMEGSVGVESCPGVGSRFWIALPHVEEKTPTPQATDSWSTGTRHTVESDTPRSDGVGAGRTKTASTATRPRVLVAEDNPFNQKVIASQLASLNIEFCAASNGADALRRLSTEPFDLLVTDLMMPEMDGLELCRRVRQHTDPRVTTLTIIVLTANALASAHHDALAAGANIFLTKPIGKAMLQSAVMSELQRSSS